MAKAIGNDWISLSVARRMVSDDDELVRIIERNNIPLIGRYIPNLADPIYGKYKPKLSEISTEQILNYTLYSEINQFSGKDDDLSMYEDVFVSASKFGRAVSRIEFPVTRGRKPLYNWDFIRVYVETNAASWGGSQAAFFRSIISILSPSGENRPHPSLFIKRGLNEVYRKARAAPVQKSK